MAATAKQSRRLIEAGLLGGLGMAIFIAAAIYGYVSLRAVVDSTDARKTARENLIQAKATLSLLKDVETGQRGYLLTGRASYLAPYEAAHREVGPLYGKLRAQVAPVPGTGEHIARLDRLIPQRLAIAEKNVSLLRDRGWNAVRVSLLSDEGKQAMDAIRVEFDRLERVMREEIARRNHEVENRQRHALWATIAMSVIGTGLLALAYGLLSREQRQRLRAEQALADTNAGLEATVRQRTADLEMARDQLRAFATQLDSSIEAERRRLAREVHDQIGQIFTALKIGLPSGQQSPARLDLDAIRQLLDEGIAVSRRISADLRPPMLDDLGLAPALAHYAKAVAEQGGFDIALAVSDDARLGRDQANQLFRIAQEALTNVLRHARAKRVGIEGAVSDGHYVLRIEDDGHGFDLARVRAGALGLLGIRERAALAGGNCLVESPLDGGGTRISVTLPLIAESS